MAHPQQLQFVKSIAGSLSNNFQSIKVIEIGSYDVNGSIRQFFPNADYLGVDLTEGPGVDLVCEGDKVPHPTNTFDISISCECFEHNPNWSASFMNMYRMTKEGGIVIFTCATTGRPEHGTTRTSPLASPGTQSLNWDYYQNLTQNDFESLGNFDELFESHFFLLNKNSHDLYFFGYKIQSNNKNPNSSDTLKIICESDQEILQSVINKIKKSERFIPKPLRKHLRKKLIRLFSGSSNLRLIDNFDRFN
jgi:SAM-dependent methyltransferase